MRRNKPGRVFRIPTGRGIAVTSAGRISAGGTVAAVIIVIGVGLIVGQSVLHGVGRAFTSPTHRASAQPGASARRSPARRPAMPSAAALTGAVQHLMSAERGITASRDYGTLMTHRPVVQVTRTAGKGTWVLGSTAIPVPAGTAAPPSTALFLARVANGRWDVALSGGPGFSGLLALASGRVITASEAAALARFNAKQDTHAPAGAPAGAAGGGGGGAGAGAAGAGGATGGAAAGATPLALPWRAGQSWRLGAASGGRPSPQAAASLVAFAGGDGKVRAAAAGRLYRFCGKRGTDALIEIIHADGSATEYGQLAAETRTADGGFVAQGAYLGVIGSSLPCGGTLLGASSAAATRNGAAPPGHAVAFAVLGSGGAVDLNGLTIGGWILREHGVPPMVSAQHAAAQVKPGGLMKNFGASVARAASAKPTAGSSPSASATSTPGM